MHSSRTAALSALLLADGRLPTGGHAHSSGLEPAVVAGLSTAGVPDYLRVRIHTVARMEAAAAVQALRVVRAGLDRTGLDRTGLDRPGLDRTGADRAGPVDGAEQDPVEQTWAGLRTIDAALAARTPSAPLRTASRSLGRGLARLVVRQFPDAPATAALTRLTPNAFRPVALGVLAALLALSEASTARAVLYDDVQTVSAASLKLLPVDPTDTVGWILDLADDIESVVTDAVAITDVADLPACSTPLIEQYSFAHHHRTRRIFVA